MARLPRPQRKRVTQLDVARAANVSTSIVSTVINNSSSSIRVSEETRARVWEAVRELQYVPNVVAQSLARGRNKLIGAFTYQTLFPWAQGDFYYQFLLGIEEEAEREAYNLMLFTGARNDAGERSIYGNGTNMLEMADGAILVGGRIEPSEIHRLSSEGYPFVMIGRRDAIGSRVPWVAADYVQGTTAVFDTLVELGHADIGLIIGAKTHETVSERRQGFFEARARHDLDQRIPLFVFGELNPDYPDALCATSIADLVDMIARHRPTALIVESTYLAHRLYEAITADGRLSVPRDLSLVGLGDHADRANVLTPDPAVAQLVTPGREIGAMAVRMLLRRLDDPTGTPEEVRIPCELEIGATVSSPQ